MKFLWSTLKVRNMEESIAFYEDILGLKTNRRFQAGPDMDIAFLGEGETQIELIEEKSRTEIELGQDISWGFEVDSLEEMKERLQKRGVEILAGPFQPNPFTRFIYILDPNGLKIQFVENSHPEVRK